jgi:competence protein ComEC
MRTFSLAFLCGVLLLQYFTFLPNLNWLWLWPILIFLQYKIIKKNYTQILLIILLGFSWTLIFAQQNLTAQKSLTQEGIPIIISGCIASIPIHNKYQTSFLFKSNQFGLLKLSWQSQQLFLHAGDCWQLTVKLKKIHGMLNPGGFDYEKWALQAGLHGSGYILNNYSQKLLTRHWYSYSMMRVREYLLKKICLNLPPSNTAHWLIALVIGERQGIDVQQWEVLRRTGTNHLMAIAGLHIGCLAGLFYIITNWLWRRVPRLLLRLPAQSAGLIASLISAIIYSALAGFSLPTQRACLMLCFFVVMTLCRRKILTWQAWSAALLGILILNPLSVLSESFWLSFGSVALIIYGIGGRLAPKGIWWHWGRLQWVIGLGLIPLSIALFHEASFVSFIANSIAIPIVGFVLVPLTLFATLCLIIWAPLGKIVFALADLILHFLWDILAYFAKLPAAAWHHFVPDVSFILAAVVGVVLLLMPVGVRGRWFGLIWLLPILLYKPAPPKMGEAWFTLLDVGQGLAAVVQTRHHLLVFDTGAKLSESFDMGESVVAPFIFTTGNHQIDMLVISHGDNDHSGGAQALYRYFKIKTARSSTPEKLLPHPASYCLRGEQWQWDNVQFAFLYPDLDQLNLNNNSSCVLQITANNKKILLTGDIEKSAEKYLHRQMSDALGAEILVAPHHGSKTSAVDLFLKDVSPRYVLFPVGYRNRYHFPNPIVLHKYELMGANLLLTSEAGAIEFKLNGGAEMTAPVMYRLSHRYFWGAVS